MRTIAVVSSIMVVFSASSVIARGQDGTAAIQRKLESEYLLTKTTADQSDIVTAGAVLVLQKDNLLMMASTTIGNPCPNTYRDGKLNQSGMCRAGEKLRKMGRANGNVDNTTRSFVAGEKFWITKIGVKDTGKEPAIALEFFSDAINDVRYKTSLTIPFKGALPSPDEALKLVAEVVTVAPSDDKESRGSGIKDKGNSQQPAAQGGQPAQPAAVAAQPAAAPTAQPEAPPPAIAPPPPPPADPPTVSLGQTPDDVVAALGQPVKKTKLANKEIYYYKDLKVTFLDGKVKDIE